jgi:hypothetical protein
VAGLLAVLAGAGAVWATIASAKREVTAARDQTEAARVLERRRVAREALAFYSMLGASMLAIRFSIDAIRSRGLNAGAFYWRQTVDTKAFPELRGAFLQFSGPLTFDFLRLERDIDRFVGDWTLINNRPSQTAISQLTECAPGGRKRTGRLSSQSRLTEIVDPRTSCLACRIRTRLSLP